MKRQGPFAGRTLAVVNDFSRDEQRYLYRVTRELKRAAAEGRDLSAYRMDSRDYQAYLVFMEDSTRTRESFRNAASFLGCRVNIFDSATSSFNKNESVADTVKMLYGYAEDSCFVIRSKLEGVCRALEIELGDYAYRLGRPRASFINAGDGKHEHPTQEFLDEFSFLEQLGWKDDSIHLALTGDLFHGRTVHSKADGLGVFREVVVDLVAPEPLRMPRHYVERMKAHGFEVREYFSLDEYLASGKVAPIWYFTRLQLERMGDAVLEKAASLRHAVTFREDMLGKLPEGARFYHPLPRDRRNPTNPFFLDRLPLNGWDGQSINGYWTRIVEIGMLSGLYGGDFEGETATQQTWEDDFVREVPVVASAKPEYKVGIKPVEDGVVIDHVATGKPLDEIWDRIDTIRKLLGLNMRSSHGVYHSSIGQEAFKGIISLPGVSDFDERNLKKLGAISPECTLNIIRNHRVARKFRLSMPPRIYGFERISCKNENCVSHPSHLESVQPDFVRIGTDRFACRYCEREHGFGEIWDL